MSSQKSQHASLISGDSGPFRLQKVASFGTGEPWLARIEFGIPELSKIATPNPEIHKEFTDAWLTAGMKLSEAFGILIEIRKLTADPDATLIDLSRNYTSFYSLLWAAYKDRWQTAMKLLDFDMSFLFIADAPFETKWLEFEKAHPTLDLQGLKQMAIDDRTGWQKRLQDYRNLEIEHRTGDQRVEDYENLMASEILFDNVWRAMEDWAIHAIGESVKPPMFIFMIPKNERNSANPQKYKLGFDTSSLPQPNSDLSE